MSRRALVSYRTAAGRRCLGFATRYTAIQREVARAHDNALIESFQGSMHIERLDRRTWTTRPIWPPRPSRRTEAFYDPTRQHCSLHYLSR